MQTDIKMQEYDGEERRALNMIWTAAKDHSFRPEGVVLCRSPYHVEGPPLLPVIFLHFNIGLQTASPFPVF